MIKAPELQVIGGGIAGACVAWFAREAGMDVTLVDGAGPASSATWASGGMLAPRAEGLSAEALAEGLDALALHETWLPEVEQAAGMPIHRGHGLVRVLPENTTPPPGAPIPDLPGLRHLAHRATWSADEGWVDPRGLLLTLRSALRRRGVRFVRGTARAVNLAGPQPGLELGDDRLIRADRVIVAAGHLAKQLGGISWHAIGDVRGDRGILAHVAGVEPPPAVLFEFDGQTVTYVVPDPSGVRIGSTSSLDDARQQPDPAETAALLTRAARLWPIDGGSLGEVTVGFRPWGPLPDGRPFVGSLDRIGRVWGLLGLHRNGILLGPLLARQLVDRLLERPPVA